MFWLGVLALVVAIVSVVLGPLIGAVAVALGVLAFRGGARKTATAAFVIVGISVLLRVVFVVVFGGKAYVVPSGSMAPTFEMGDRIATVRESDPEVGDIVVFNSPADALAPRCVPAPGAACDEPADRSRDDEFIKRVVAVGGDTFRMVRGTIYVNDEPLDFPACEGASAADTRCHYPKEITIPEDTVFVVGDNLGSSEDSRAFGPIPLDFVNKRVIFTYWPLDRIGGIG